MAVDSDFDVAFRLQMEEVDVESDLGVAFRFQMEEAMIASHTMCSTASSSSDAQPHFAFDVVKDDDGSYLRDAIVLQREELENLNQQESDRKSVEALMKHTREELELRLLDHRLALELSDYPEFEHCKKGVHYGGSFGEGTSNRINTERFGLYSKGLVIEERTGSRTMKFAGIGLALCDSNDTLLFQVRKPYVSTGMTGRIVELEAVIECLKFAHALDMKDVTLFVDDATIYPYVSRAPVHLKNGEEEVGKLAEHVQTLRKKFSTFVRSFVLPNQMKFVYEFANEAIDSQRTPRAECSSSSRRRKTVVSVNCAICFEDFDEDKMFSVEGCMHPFCHACLKEHISTKLKEGVMPACPQPKCKSMLSIDKCGSFLPKETVELMNLRMKESILPLSDKLYCPYSKCSALMSASAVLQQPEKSRSHGRPRKRKWHQAGEGDGDSGMRRCTNCKGLFCLYCKVPWHANTTCNSYRISNPRPLAEEALVKSIAKKENWRQCVKCSHIIELALGCNHIYCRCGHEFCYVCGAEWRNKSSTCKCPLWAEGNIEYG